MPRYENDFRTFSKKLSIHRFVLHFIAFSWRIPKMKNNQYLRLDYYLNQTPENVNLIVRITSRNILIEITVIISLLLPVYYHLKV